MSELPIQQSSGQLPPPLPSGEDWFVSQEKIQEAVMPLPETSGEDWYSSIDSKQPWRPVVKEKLTEGESVIIDSNYDAFSVDDIGLSVDERTTEGAGVVAKVVDDTIGTDVEAKVGISFSVVRIKEKSGVDTFHMVSDKVDNEGNTIKNYITLAKGVKFTIGRLNAGSPEDGHMIDGKELVGENFSDSISRKHLTVELTDNGLEIKNLSRNGTSVEGVKVADERFRPISSQGVMQSSGVEVNAVPEESSEKVLIDKVPKSQEDLDEIRKSRLEEQNRPIKEQLDSVEQEFAEFKSQFTEDETLNMWKYAAGMMNKREAQQRGDGQGSYAEEMNAGEGLTGLRNTSDPQRRQELLSAADKYMSYMQQISNLRTRIK